MIGAIIESAQGIAKDVDARPIADRGFLFGVPAIRQKNCNSVIVRLASPDSLSTFRKALTGNPVLPVTVERRTDWHHKLNNQFYTFFNELALWRFSRGRVRDRKVDAAVGGRRSDRRRYRLALYDGRQDSIWINVFYLTVSPALVEIGIVWAVVVALLGGLLPAIRAARRPVAEALRAI